jgi:hypothetical protein
MHWGVGYLFVRIFLLCSLTCTCTCSHSHPSEVSPSSLSPFTGRCTILLQDDLWARQFIALSLYVFILPSCGYRKSLWADESHAMPCHSQGGGGGCKSWLQLQATRGSLACAILWERGDVGQENKSPRSNSRAESFPFAKTPRGLPPTHTRFFLVGRPCCHNLITATSIPAPTTHPSISAMVRALSCLRTFAQAVSVFQSPC